MKSTDLVASILKKNNITEIFGLQGGSIVHLFDSLEKYKLKVHYNLHEQSASFAAVSNSKATDKITCVLVTTGPGSTNAMTGLLAAWQDSVPVIFISGQARDNHTSYGKKVRQVGTQELKINEIVKPITKKTFFIKNKNQIEKTFYDAISLSGSGRPGPVWIDFPVNIQWEFFNKKVIPKKVKLKKDKFSKMSFKKTALFKNLVSKSQKPLLILGYGVRLSKQSQKLLKIIKKKKLPFVTTWNAKDIYPSKMQQNIGVIGLYGMQGANKAVFDSDLLICMGTRMAIPHTGSLFSQYSKNSKKIIINDDKNEIKNLNIKFDLSLNIKIENFIHNFKYFNKVCWKTQKYVNLNWVNQIKNHKPNSKEIVKYITEIYKLPKCIITDGSGNALYTTFQCSDLNSKDRLICSAAVSSMGAGLADTFGAWLSKKFSKIFCIIGDGSFVMNLQDLQTLKDYKVNSLIILVNNNGYAAIRDTQKDFLNKRYYGAHSKWKLKMPDYSKVIKSFGINYFSLKKRSDVNRIKLKQILNSKGPTVLEVFVSEKEEILFRQKFLNKKGKNIPITLDQMNLGLK